MSGGFKQQWREFHRGRPGHRFQDRFERNRKAQDVRARETLFLKPLGALVLLVGGVVFCLIPGPGLPLLLIGAGLLADVSHRVAVLLDWIEVRSRNKVCQARRWWRRALQRQ